MPFTKSCRSKKGLSALKIWIRTSDKTQTQFSLDIDEQTVNRFLVFLDSKTQSNTQWESNSNIDFHGFLLWLLYSKRCDWFIDLINIRKKGGKVGICTYLKCCFPFNNYSSNFMYCRSEYNYSIIQMVKLHFKFTSFQLYKKREENDINFNFACFLFIYLFLNL